MPKFGSTRELRRKGDYPETRIEERKSETIVIVQNKGAEARRHAVRENNLDDYLNLRSQFRVAFPVVVSDDARLELQKTQ